MDDSSVTLSLSIEKKEEEQGETEGLLLLLHLPQSNYTNNNTWYVIRIEEESLGGVQGVCSSEVFVIPYLIARLTAIKMFNLGI